MDNGAAKLGLNFVGKKLRLIEAESQAGQLNVTTAVESSLDVPFDFSAIGDQDILPRFSNAIKNVLDSANIKVKTARLALDKRMTLSRTVKVDRALNEQELRHHIEWELEQFLISSRDEYNVGFERVSINKLNADIVVIVAVRKAIVDFISKIFKGIDIELDTVDIDLLASIRALNAGNSDFAKGLNVLASFRDRSVELSIAYDGKFVDASEITVDSAHSQSFYEMSVEEQAVLVKKTAEALIERLGGGLKGSSMSSLFLCGDRLPVDLLSELEKLSVAKSVTKADPFKNIRRQLNIESEMLIQENPHLFLPTLGMVV